MDTSVSNIPESEATKKLREAAVNGTTEKVEIKQEPQVIKEVVVEYPNDLKALLEKVRTEEKTKLYDRIKRAESIESENQALRARNADLESKFKEIEAQQAAQSTKKSKSDDYSAIVQDTALALRKEFDEKLSALQKENEILRTMSTTSKLDVLRAKLISESNGAIIPGMVRGTTEDEMLQSAIEARAEYQRVFGSVTPRVQAPIQPQASAPGMVPSAHGSQPAAPMPISRTEPTSAGANVTGASEAEKLSQEVKHMTPQQYKQHREAIRHRVRSQFPANNNPMLRG